MRGRATLARQGRASLREPVCFCGGGGLLNRASSADPDASRELSSVLKFSIRVVDARLVNGMQYDRTTRDGATSKCTFFFNLVPSVTEA